LFVAVNEHGSVTGVGAIEAGVAPASELWAVDVEAMGRYRGQGVEAGLVQYALANAPLHGAAALATARWYEPDSPGVAEWRRLGFVDDATRYVHELAAARAHERLAPLVEQIRAHGWIPQDVRVISLAEADPRAVCELHVRHLGGTTEQVLPLVDGRVRNAYDRDASMVLMHGEHVAGFTLGGFPEPDVCDIGANVLAPEARLGWADLLLKYSALERVIARGATTLRFVTAEAQRDSRRTLQWIGGGSTRAEIRLRRDCGSAAASGKTGG
jgi:hypothetical protein